MTKARIQLDANQITQSIMQKLSQPLPEAGPNPQLLVSVYQEIFNRNSAFNSSAAQTTLLPVRPFPDVAFKSQAYKSMSFTESTEDNTTPSDRLDQETLYKSIISRTHIFNSSTAQTTLLPARPFPDLASKSQAHKSMSFMELIEENTPLYDRLNQEALYKSIISRRGKFLNLKKKMGKTFFS